jgi:hypothetical protein
MKASTLSRLPSHAVMVGFAAVFVPYLDGFLEVRGQLPVPVLVVNLFLYALVAVSAVTLLGAVASARGRARLMTLYAAHLSVLLPLAVLAGLSFISGIRGTAYMDEGPRLVMFPAYWVVVVLLSMLLPLPEHRHRGFRWYLLVAFGVIAASVLVDVVNPGTFSLTADRAAGLAANPNIAAFLLVALCCSIISFERVRALDLGVLVVTMLCVLATLSRGGVMMLALVVAWYGSIVIRSGWRRGMHFVVARAAVLLLLVGAMYGAATLLLDQKIFNAFAGSSRVGMLQGRERVVDVRESRIVVVKESWSLIREAPLAGYGSGFAYTLPIGPHNIFLARWLDLGLLGPVTLVWLLGAMAVTFSRRRYQAGLVFTAVVTLQGFFSHNLLEERVFFLLLGVLLTQSYHESVAAAAEPVPARGPDRLVLGRIHEQLDSPGVVRRIS